MIFLGNLVKLKIFHFFFEKKNSATDIRAYVRNLVWALVQVLRKKIFKKNCRIRSNSMKNFSRRTTFSPKK